MFKSLVARSLMASVFAWPFGLCGLAVATSDANLEMKFLVDKSIVFIVYGSLSLGSWLFFDALFLRPTLLPRLGWRGLVPIEAVSLYGCELLRWWRPRDTAAMHAWMIQELKGMSALYASYLAVSVFLLYLLKRFADRKLPPTAS